MKNKRIVISLGILAAILIAGVFGGDKPPQAQAGSSQNVSGFAWSENIGWISFNSNDCDTDKNGYVDSGLCGGDNSTKQAFDYGVNIDPTTGAFSGWAWSENIGWIYFGSAFQIIVRIAPEEPRQWAKLDLATNQVSGWAKAWAGGTDGSGGWDGWIKMSDVGNINFNWIDSNGTHNGVIRNDCKLQGYAWGSDVIGWIQFDPVNVDCQNIPSNPPGVITTLPPTQNQPPTVTLTANPSTIDSGQSSTLIWTTTNDPTSCVAAGDWSGSKSAGGGTESVSPTQTSTYAITCSKTDFDDVSSSATVTVNANQPPTANAGLDLTINEGIATTLQGSGSDPEGGSLTYSWSPSTYLSVSNIQYPIFTAPEVSTNSVYPYTLTVTDPGGLSGSDSVNITVLDVSPPPPPPPPAGCPDGQTKPYLSCEGGVCVSKDECGITNSSCSGKSTGDQCVFPTFREI